MPIYIRNLRVLYCLCAISSPFACHLPIYVRNLLVLHYLCAISSPFAYLCPESPCIIWLVCNAIALCLSTFAISMYYTTCVQSYRHLPIYVRNLLVLDYVCAISSPFAYICSQSPCSILLVRNLIAICLSMFAISVY